MAKALRPYQQDVADRIANPHPFQKQIDFVREFLHFRMIPHEVTPTQWGCVIECESVRFNFNRKTVNLYTGETINPQSVFNWKWEEQLYDTTDPVHIDHWIRRMCCAAHYVEMARQCMKAPAWFHVLPTVRPATGDREWRDTQGKIEDARIRITVFVKLQYLGKETLYHYLDGEEYHVCELDLNDRESDRVSARHFRNVIHALGSPVGQSHTDGHKPHLEGNFLEDGPFTFVPATATETITSPYMLPDLKPTQWSLWVLIKTHDVKMEAK